MGNMKYKVGDKVRIKSIDWYNENKDEFGNIGHFSLEMAQFCGQITIISEETPIYYRMENIDNFLWTDEMIEGLVEEETPKFKINDIVFVKNIGWVRITNSYWDSLANEYIYEAIGFNGEGEYDSINQSNIESQMLPESENPHTGGNKITLDEYKNNDKEWLFNKLAMLDNITALESIQDIFNHLQQSKYPKTYEECCKVFGLNHYLGLGWNSYDEYSGVITCLPKQIDDIAKKLESLSKLLICRDAYWKLYGEDMGLGKPWEPDLENEELYCIQNYNKQIIKSKTNTAFNKILIFPTEEMRDAFYENFKEEIEKCKELL